MNDTGYITYCTYKYKNNVQVFKYNLLENNKWWFSEFLFQRSALYKISFLKLIGFLNKQNKKIADRTFYTLLKDIKELLDTKKISLVAVVYPYLMSYSEYDDLTRNSYSNIKQSCVDLQIPLLDLHSVFAQETNGRLEILKARPSDYVHLNWRKSYNFILNSIGNFLRLYIPG